MFSQTLSHIMPLPAYFALLLSLVVGVVLLQRRIARARSSLKQLPGPKGYPFIGSALEIPNSHAWLKFAEWSQQYGPIYQVKAFGTTLVIISKESIANDLLGLRGAIYSDRPSLVMPRLVSDDGFLGAMAWGDYWRRARRYAQAMLSHSNVSMAVAKQTTEARQMVIDMFKEPTKYPYWLERAGVTTSLHQIYGITESRGPAEERHVHQICSYMETIERVAIPGAYLVEFVPALKYLPVWLAPFKREAAALVDKHWRYLASLVQPESPAHISEKADPNTSFMNRYHQAPADWKISDRELVWVLSSIYGGAAGTSSSAVQTIMLNMCLFSEWQEKIQAELDRVVGNDRIPAFEDSEDLPITRAVIKESMRWRPVLPGGFPHASLKDDVYKGYHIPKGAVIIPNQWAMFRDEELYPHGDSFKPERWLEPNWPTFKEPLPQYPNLKKFAGFGHGRRVCPGLELAENAIFLQVATLYWACRFSPPLDVAGKAVVMPEYDFTGMAISTPREFSFVIQERSAGRIERLRVAAGMEFEKERLTS